MKVGGVMRVKLVTASPYESAGEAIRRMVEARIGSIVVCEDNEPVGIFTERDVLRLAGQGIDFDGTALREVMTTRLVTIDADDRILDAARLMAERRLRHLPVVEGGLLAGIVSMRDVLAFLAERLFAERDATARETAAALLERR